MTVAFRRLLGFLAAYGIVAALALELLFFSLRSPYFLTWENQLNVLRQNSAVAVLAAGMTFVILSAGIDLSVGSLVALSGVTAAAALLPEWGPLALRIPAAILAGVLVGGVLGLVNGAIVTGMRIPPFVATLAMMTIARGIALHATESRTISGLPGAYGELGTGIWPILVLLVVFGLSWVVLTRMPFGRHVYAVGGNPEAAHLCGIPVRRVLILVYSISGLLAGLAGVMVGARLGSGYPNAGVLYELDAIAAVVVGGTSLMGGRGSVWGTLVGALVIGELNNGLNLLDVEYYTQKILIGVVLLGAAWLDRFRQERS